MRIDDMHGDDDLALARRLSIALAVVFGAASLGALVAPSVFNDPPATVGNARGTAVAILLLAIPTMLVALARRESPRATIVWLGALAYLLYNAVIFAFAVGFNALFPCYVASLSLATCALVALLVRTRADALTRAASPRMPVRAIGGYLIGIAIAFAVVWLLDIAPAIVRGTTPEGLRGTRLLTSPVEVLDLAFTLPLALYGGMQLWRRRPPGFLIAGVILVMLELEGASVAIDQWFGHRADPAQPLVTVAIFIALTLVGLVPPLAFLRHLRGERDAPIAAHAA